MKMKIKKMKNPNNEKENRNPKKVRSKDMK